MIQKLSQRARWPRSGVAQLESEAQHGLAAKARFFSLERSCPTLSMALVLTIVWMVAGIVLNKDNGPTPLGRLSRFRRPGQATLNSTENGEQ